MRNKHVNDIFEAFKNQGIPLDETQKKRIEERMKSITSYVPKVGVFGKTGVGKSSLTNAMFGTDVCKISDIGSCTRNPQEVLLGIAGNNGISLLDVPGVGESRERDDEYSDLYQKLLPELDVVLWLLKGDDRAFTSDQIFYEQIVKPYIERGKPFFFVINQVDKIEPFREWDELNRRPGAKQQQNIELKVKEVSRYFDVPSSKVIPVSANEKYNLITLTDEIVFSLPPEQLVTFGKAVDKEILSDKSQEHIKKASTNYVLSGAVSGATIGAAVGGPIGAAVGGAIGAAVGWVSSGCYITTATLMAVGNDDNCYELNLLRSYRDSWLCKQENGIKEINEYYDVAPKIVNAINKLKTSHNYYISIYNTWISDVISLIEAQNNISARVMYRNMVKTLTKELNINK